MRQEPHLRHNIKHVVSRETSATARQRGGTYVQMECVSCTVASCLRCSSHASRDPRDSLVTMGTHRQLKWYRLAMAWRVVGRLEREEGGGQSAWQVLEFLCRRGRQFDHMNTRSRDIAQLMLTFSSSREAQLICHLHRQDRAPHGPLDSSTHSARPCITELAI